MLPRKIRLCAGKIQVILKKIAGDSDEVRQKAVRATPMAMFRT